MRNIYLDNSATTAVCKEAIEKTVEMMTRCYGNPSSLHTMGIEAERELMLARSQVAALIGASPVEIFFTSGGTEANNLATFGGIAAHKRRGNRIVTTAVEHASVLEAVKELERQGFEVVRLVPNANGEIPQSMLEEAIDNKTILISMMLVNNETGMILPVERLRRIVQEKNAPALIHTDAVQAAGKMKLEPSKLGVDLMTVSSHKIHGPKGAGALYISKSTRILPMQFGGGQERRIRPGTEPLPAICGFGAAAQSQAVPVSHFAHLKNHLLASIKERFTEQEVIINSTDRCVPWIVSLSLPGFKAETLLHYLAQRNIYVSSGSACSQGKPSHVLAALGLPFAAAEGTLRISFSIHTTTEELDIFTQTLSEARTEIKKKRM